jgi:hypothetical protein
MTASSRLKFFFLSVRDPKTDFRRELVTALRQLGHQVVYVRLARRCFVDNPEIGSERFVSPLIICWWMFATCYSRQRTVVFNTVNLGFPVFCTFLRILSWRTVWCFDLHDDLLYNTSGIARTFAKAKLACLQFIATFSVRAAPTLHELHPRSRALGNASSIARTPRTTVSGTNILVLSSVDDRFDFDLMEEISDKNSDVAFHVYGEVAKAPAITAAFERLKKRKNICYFGAYQSSDIAQILMKYDITLAPYKIARSTRYIDPLRYYHCLNSGLEIITVPIPRALDMIDSLHVISSAEEVRSVIEGLCHGRIARRNGEGREPISWNRRADELLSLVSEFKF